MGQTERCFCYLAKNKAMSLLTIEIDSPEDEAILLSLLPKLNGKVIKKNQLLKRNRLSILPARLQLIAIFTKNLATLLNGNARSEAGIEY